MKIEVTACDIDQQVPAVTYTITASDGRSISKDLCAEHGEPFEEWLEEADVEPAPGPELVAAAERAVEQVVSQAPAKEAAPAKKTPAKKAAPAKKAVPATDTAPAKKASSRRRTAQVVSLEEIERQKQR